MCDLKGHEGKKKRNDLLEKGKEKNVSASRMSFTDGW